MRFVCETCSTPLRRKGRRFCSRKCITRPWLRREHLGAEFLARRAGAVAIAKKDAFGTEDERFDAKVERGTVDYCGYGPCLLWTGATDENGYGMFSPDGRKRASVRAHRWALARWLKRPIKDGLFALHTCGTPACVSPLHLYEGTKKDNADDRDGTGSAIERRELWLASIAKVAA